MDKKYKSKYLADSEVTSAQILTEFICERMAKRDGVTLPVKFWNTEKWGKIFIRQIAAANKLLKNHTLAEILSALAHKKGWWITSLGATSYIEDLIKNYGSGPQISTKEEFVHTMDYADDNSEAVDTKVESQTLWKKLTR